MSVSIAFVANFHMTETYFAISRELMKLRPGLRVSWFAFSAKWCKWLVAQGVSESDVILLGRAPHSPPPGVLNGLSLLDGEPSIEELLAGDRVLKARPAWKSLGLLARVSQEVAEQVGNRKISTVFGESTWAAEVVVAYACRSVGVEYLSPASVRYPVGRFGFFRAPMQQFPIRLRGTSSSDRTIAAECLSELHSERPPVLWAANEFDVSEYMGRLSLLFEKFRLSLSDSRGNPTQLRLQDYVSRKNPYLLKKWSQQARQIMRSAPKSPAAMPGPYVLMPLQLQPEASIDVLAAWARDQLANVRHVAACVPHHVTVAVKEHTHQFGSRNPRFYRDLLALPRVKIVDAFSDSREWAEQALAVISPTGTMAYENALRGRRSFVMAPMFFDRLTNVTRIRPGGFDVLSSLENVPVREDELLTFLAQLSSASHPGVISNPRTNPEVLGSENLRVVALGFDLALSCRDEL